MIIFGLATATRQIVCGTGRTMAEAALVTDLHADAIEEACEGLERPLSATQTPFTIGIAHDESDFVNRSSEIGAVVMDPARLGGRCGRKAC